MQLYKILLICILAIISNLTVNAQKSLYYGLHFGAAYAITERFLADQQHPNFTYVTKVKPAMGFMLEYWFADNYAARLNTKRTSYMYGFTINDLLANEVYDSLGQLTFYNVVGGGISGGLTKNHYDLSLQSRLPLIKSRFYLRQGLGLVIMPGIVKYNAIPHAIGGDYPLLSYRAYNNPVVSNRFNYGFSANLGLDYKFGKKYDRFFYLNLDYTKCFIENEHVNINYAINGQSYKAQIKSYGDYFSAQIGYKAPWSTLRSKKKREELKTQNR